MDCNVIRDLIPLYIDDCCREESRRIAEKHIDNCAGYTEVLDDMNSATQVVTEFMQPKVTTRVNDWKASVLQSVLLLVSFSLVLSIRYFVFNFSLCLSKTLSLQFAKYLCKE